MGLSNYLPSSRISQAGVCTSTTRPASPYEGQMIYETDTNRVLVWDNAAWVMIADTDEPPGLQLIKTQAFTSTQNCDVTACFSEDYENYVAIVNGTFSLTGQITAVQLLNSTTPKTTNYNRACFFMTPTVNLTMIGQATGAADFFVSGQNTTHNSIQINFYRPNMNQPTGLSSEGQYGAVVWRGGGEQTENYVADGFRILPVGNAALFTGTVRVYGIRI